PQGGRPRGAAASQGGRAHARPPGGGPHLVTRGARHRRGVSARRQQLHRQTGRLRIVRPGGLGRGALLGAVERAAPLTRMPTLARILIVEDVATDAELIEREIHRAGIGCATRRVDTEPALRDALRSFAPDLVLTDHSMPRLTARDTLQLVQQETPNTPVIIVTGSLDEEIAAEYMKAGATDYVVKHHLERLGPAVRRALELLHPDDGPRLQALLADPAGRRGAPLTIELRLLHRDASWRAAEAVVVNRLGEPAVGAIVVNFRDISERKEAELALRDSEEQYRSLVEGVRD